MKGKLTSGVLTTMLVLAAPCSADQFEWQASGSSPAATKTGSASQQSPSIQLGSPQAWNGKPAAPSEIKRTTFHPGALPLGPVIRANGGENVPPIVSTGEEKASPKNVVTDPEVIPVPPKAAVPTNTPPPAAGVQTPPGYVTMWGDGPVVGSPAMSGPVAGGPVVGPDPCCETMDCGACCPTAAYGGAPIWALGPCYARPRWRVSAEYLYWTFSNPEPQPLVALNQVNTPIGLIGNPVSQFTRIPLGGDEFFNGGGSGIRIGTGFWFTQAQLWGMDVSYFAIGRETDSFSQAGNGGLILSRPFVEGSDNSLSPQAIADPAFPTPFGPANLTGGILIDHDTYLWGLDANLRRALFCGPRFHIDGFLGYRHIQLTDDLRINENFTATVPNQPATQFLIQDRFATRNQFNGGQIGLEAEGHFFRRWFVNGQVKLALGSVEQTIQINGFQTIAPAGMAPASFASGVAAAPSNIGRHHRSEFAVASDFNIKLGYELTDNWRVFVGYNLMYLSDVVRAAEQVDPVVFRNTQPQYPNQAATVAPRPAVLFRSTGFLAQGLNVGLEGRW